jgi:hypothetical protein
VTFKKYSLCILSLEIIVDFQNEIIEFDIEVDTCLDVFEDELYASEKQVYICTFLFTCKYVFIYIYIYICIYVYISIHIHM